MEVRLADGREVRRDRAGEEEDDDDGGRDPEGPVEVGVTVEDVEEVGARVQRVQAAGPDGSGVDVEELAVET